MGYGGNYIQVNNQIKLSLLLLEENKFISILFSILGLSTFLPDLKKTQKYHLTFTPTFFQREWNLHDSYFGGYLSLQY